MNQPLFITPNAAAPQPSGARSTTGAAQHTVPGTPDLAVLPLSDLLQFLHSTGTGLSAPDAAAILKAVGPNRIESAKPKGLLTALMERFSISQRPYRRSPGTSRASSSSPPLCSRP